jgi:hypothetical protein
MRFYNNHYREFLIHKNRKSCDDNRFLYTYFWNKKTFFEFVFIYIFHKIKLQYSQVWMWLES